MNRSLVLMLALVALLTSCNNEAESPDTPAAPTAIGFGAEAEEGITRAMGDGELTTDLLQTTGFGVYCWYTENNDFTTPRASTYMLMRNQEVTWASHWTYSPLKYWPETPDELLTFRAYAPYTDAELNYDDNGMPRLPVSVAADDYANGTQHDPLFGTTQDGLLYTDYNYLKSGSTATSDDTDGTIHWYFHHGMAKLVFKVAINHHSSINKLTITGITVTPLYNQGILDISSTAFNHTDTNVKDKPVWYDRSGNITANITVGEGNGVEVERKSDDDVLVAADYVDILNSKGLLVIPRFFGEATTTLPDDPMTITVSYQVEGSTETKTATATISDANIQGNTVYTFYLLLDPTSNDTLTLLEVGIRTWTKAPDITHDVYNW